MESHFISGCIRSICSTLSWPTDRWPYSTASKSLHGAIVHAKHAMAAVQQRGRALRVGHAEDHGHRIDCGLRGRHSAVLWLVAGGISQAAGRGQGQVCAGSSIQLLQGRLLARLAVAL